MEQLIISHCCIGKMECWKVEMLGAEFAVAEILLDDLKQDILQQNPSINNHLMEFYLYNNSTSQ